MLKRVFDLIIAIPAMLLLQPVFAALCVSVYVTMGRPIFFVQPRSGYNGKAFNILKFRTMSNDKCVNGELLPDAQRLNPIGRAMRAMSLDELPTLINVVKGDMSLVGPRPLLMEYVPLYTEFEARRLSVKPGVTGWAQVNGRNSLSWEKKFQFDVWYVENQSIWLDLRIMLCTAIKVFSRDGINQSPDSPMERFTGTKS